VRPDGDVVGVVGDRRRRLRRLLLSAAVSVVVALLIDEVSVRYLGFDISIAPAVLGCAMAGSFFALRAWRRETADDADQDPA